MERIRRFFKKFGKGLKAKGYTLIEVAAVVAVTGTLAAVAMPVVADKIAASKLAAAQNDVNSIKDAIVNFQKDTGRPPFYKTASAGLPKVTSGKDFYNAVLVTVDGVDPENPSGATLWTLPNITTTQTASIDSQLNGNLPTYPTKGDSAWKGPYLPSVAKNIRKDPWGNKYLVAIKGLAEPEKVGSDTPLYAVFVLSAGPNGIIETNEAQVIKFIEGSGTTPPAGFALGGDDIIARIQ